MVNLPDVKILKINGIYPNIETIKNEQYPITGNIYAITDAKNNKPNLAKFLDWILSEQGQYIVEKTGYCPVD
jgi:phosphate transport system substrate-binding protein